MKPISTNSQSIYTRRKGAPWWLFVIFTSLWWNLFFNAPFFDKVLGYFPESGISIVLSLLVALSFLTWGLLEVLRFLPKAVFKTILILFFAFGSVSFISASKFGIAITPNMARNFISTDSAEVYSFLSWGIVASSLLAFLPGAILSLLVNPTAKPGFLSIVSRLGTILFAILVAVAAILINAQSITSFFREHKDVRYYIAPYSAPYSLIKTQISDSATDKYTEREIIEPNPIKTIKTDKPTLLVFVVGETARAANWQASGYTRETTPNILKTNAIHFTDVTACGTSTDVSLPCLMSPIGRFNYDRERILKTEPLPNLLKRAGFSVTWLDNQSGCKGTCNGVSESFIKHNKECPTKGCLDKEFIEAIQTQIQNIQSDSVTFLHFIGSHGPAYYERYNDEAKLFEPECNSSDFSKCTKEEIINSYDNSLRESDLVLSGIIDELKKAESTGVNAALFYVSDHGESLGEKGLYLHGAPYLIAPEEQKKVPMMLWVGDNFAKNYDVNVEEIRAHRNEPTSHDAIFASILNLLKVKTTQFEDLPKFVP